ncbi:DUF1800 family protein [Aquabacterium sp. NJ1]|uniref:DUF1800 domain-containing protein n=1 Tax=Aquabacterium sp. NJ1 TaxID=1538295 RepID=UPI0009DCC880|nr:DUF1800 family protein [Aquabacterium sp. NJ1]
MNVQPLRTWRQASLLATALFTALLLSACGGGQTDTSGPTYSDPPSLPQSLQDIVPDDAQAARFLTQATFGPDMEGIAELRQIGYGNWLNRQFARPRLDTHWDYAQRMGPPGCDVCDASPTDAPMESFWFQAVLGTDQLRQRVALALSEIFVISAVNSNIDDPVAYAAYLDMLSRNAFGNFRNLIEDVTRQPAMGYYLSHIVNMKEDSNPKSATYGRTPDENYAREVMQLFTIGLWQIDDYGHRKQDANHQDIPTYGLDDVMGLARVMTGLSWNGPDQSNNTWWGKSGKTWNQPMQMYPQYHSSGDKVFLSVHIPATTDQMTQAMADADLKMALDTLFRHPNVPAFFGRQLIKRLVTSNPSDAYVYRVAQAFKDNGNGVRGDMKAVVRAVLLDPEARDPSKLDDPNWGKLREPMIRWANYLRAFHVRSGTNQYRNQYLEDPAFGLAQSPLHAPSVFNWYSPDYSPPGELLDAGLTAPEFQITHETSLTGYDNFMENKIRATTAAYVSKTLGKADAMVADYSAEIALANDPDKLLDRLNILLMNGQMSPATHDLIKDTLNRITAKAWIWPKEDTRVHMAIRLLMASPEYLVQK